MLIVCLHCSESSLIEFTDPTAGVGNTQQDEEFDMFAQSRGTTFADSRQAGSTYADNTEGVPTEGVAGVLSARGPYPKLPTPEPVQVCTVANTLFLNNLSGFLSDGLLF